MPRLARAARCRSRLRARRRDAWPRARKQQGIILDKILDAMQGLFTMTRVTGKFQITLPKRLVDIYGIQVGDEVELVAAGDTIAIVPARAAKAAVSTEERLQYFDQTTQRQREREKAAAFAPAKSRGWTRDELYSRDRSR